MSENKSRPKDERTRNWTFIVYPESAPENWREIVDGYHIQWVESPLHNRDDNADGEQKKEHWHILLLFDGKKSYEQIKEITDKISATIPQKVANVKGLVRYMVHKDNPEKIQYNWNDIKCYGGVDLNSLCAPTATERLEIQKNIINFIRDSRIIEFEDIVNYAMDNSLADWLNVLLNYSTISINAYVRSRRHKAEKANAQGLTVDKKTGEVVE